MHKPPIKFDNGTFHVKVKDLLRSERGKALINKMSKLDLVKTTRYISDCLVNEDEDKLVLEWFNHPKKLTIYYDKQSDYADYIQVWGSDMQNQMQEGTLRNLADLQTLLIWLNK